MGITSDFLKSRSSGTPKLGEWNSNYEQSLSLAKKNSKFIVTCWSNGDKCGYCTAAEKCMMDKTFTDWMKTSDAYFVFQYSGDKDKGKPLHDWIFNKTGVKYYPGYRITFYDSKGNIEIDNAIDGNTLRGSKSGVSGSKKMVENLTNILSKKPKKDTKVQYKVRFNEKLTASKINKILDSIDANDGYCPCQKQAADTKCHCKDFIENKKIGENCICNLYVKQKK